VAHCESPFPPDREASLPAHRSRTAARFEMAIPVIIDDPMTRRFRISKSPDVGDILDSIELIAAFARSHASGRYDVGEIGAEPSPSGHTSQQWGRLIRRADGRVDDGPWPSAH
jgi:hypothetical protein